MRKGADPRGNAPSCSLADAERGDHGAVAIEILRLEVVEQATTTTDQLEEPTPGVEVLVVGAEVVGEVRDALGQERDLDLGRASIGVGDV